MNNNLFLLCCKAREIFQKPETREIYLAEQPRLDPSVISSYRFFLSRPRLTMNGTHADCTANSDILIGVVDSFTSGMGFSVAEAISEGLGRINIERYGHNNNGEGRNLLYSIRK